MNEQIHVDRQALRQFIDTMRQTAAEMVAVRREATPAFTGDYLKTDTARWSGGVKVTLGVVNHDHPAFDAGEVMANRIINTVNFVVGMEEGSRAMGEIAEAILKALDEQDTIAASDLEAILARPGDASGTGPTLIPFGLPVTGA